MSKPAPAKNVKEKQRGTQDELEILAQIVTHTASVRTQILLRLKDAKARAQKRREQQLRGLDAKAE